MSAPHKNQLVADLEAAADAIANSDTQADEAHRLTAVLRRLALNIVGPLTATYAIPATDVGEETAFFLRDEPTPQADYQVLFRNVLSQLASDALIAWASGEISEGRTTEILGLNRARVREMRLEAIGRVTKPLNPEAMAQRREAAREALGDYVVLRAMEGDGEYTDVERDAIIAFWNDLVTSREFQALIDAWRLLCEPIAPHATDAVTIE